MLTVFFTELCISCSISVLRYCIKSKMSETFIMLNLSSQGPDESGEWRASVAAIDLNLMRWLVDLATTCKWLSCARKHISKKKKFKHSSLRDSSISCDSREIHCLTREFHVKFHSKKWYHTHRFVIHVISFFSWNLTWDSLVRQWIFL